MVCRGESKIVGVGELLSLTYSYILKAQLLVLLTFRKVIGLYEKAHGSQR
jgi:hypothetical protein